MSGQVLQGFQGVGRQQNFIVSRIVWIVHDCVSGAFSQGFRSKSAAVKIFSFQPEEYAARLHRSRVYEDVGMFFVALV